MHKNKKMEELREKLNKMIDKGVDYKIILKLSQELDIYIVEAMKKEDSK
jgi:hypothetical protein